jgi:hypothetical protein
MLPSETYAVIRRYNELELERFKDEWIRTRWVGTCVYNSGWVKKAKSPNEMITFPWEGGETKATQEDIQSLRKEMGWEPER